ncbi:hypothetical protein ACFLX2_01435 [Candidatus Dependentiae bacterium]
MRVSKKLFLVAVFPLLIPSNLHSAIDFKEIFNKAKTFVTGFIDEVKKKPRTNLSELFSRLPGIKEIKLLPSFDNALKSIVLESPKINVAKDTYDLKWTEPLVAGTKKQGFTVRMFLGPGADRRFGFSIGAGIPGDFTLSDLFPKLKKQLEHADPKRLPAKTKALMEKTKTNKDDLARIVDMVKFTNLRIVISAANYKDPVWGDLEWGISAGFKMRFEGPLAELEKKLFGKALLDIEFGGRITLPPKFIGTEARAKIPGGVRLIKLGDFEIQTSDLEVLVGIKGLGLMSGGAAGKLGLDPLVPFPRVKVVGGLKVKIPFQKNFLDFKTFGEFVAAVPPNLTIGSQMDGMIEDIFGIPGADIGNLGLAATFEPVFPFIRGGAFQGEVAFGKSRLKTVLSGQFLTGAPGGFNDIVVLAKGTGITKNDLIDHSFHVLKRIGKVFKIDADLSLLKKGVKAIFPPFKLGPLDLAFVPKGETEVFGKKYPQGIHLKTSGSYFGIGGGIEMHVILILGLIPTIEYTMWMDEIKAPKKAPLIIITGAGPDGVRGKGVDGPVWTANLSLKSQKAFIDGLIKIPVLGIHSETRMLVSPVAGIEFKMKHKLGGIFDTELEFQGKRSLASWWIRGHMKQNAFDEIIKFLTVTSDKMYKKVQEDAKTAQAHLNKAKANLDKEKKKLTKWERKAKEDVDKWVKKKISETQWHINNLKRKIKRAKDKCKKANFFQKIAKCVDTLAIPGWGIALGTLEVHKKVTLPKIIRKAARGGIKFASDAAKAGINIAKVAINIAKEQVKVAVFAVGVANKLGKVAAKVIKVVSKGVIQIKEVSVAGSLEDLVKKAKMAEVRVKASVFGKPFDQKYQINFKKPEQFPRQIWNGLKQIFS